MDDFINREAARLAMTALRQEDIEAFGMVIPECFPSTSAIEAINKIPSADVVSRDCYNRILAENDTMREQLAQIGKKPGDKMDDVRIVKKGEWIRGRESMTGPGKDSYTCSVCGEKTLSGFCGNPAKTNVCPNCGADMGG